MADTADTGSETPGCIGKPGIFHEQVITVDGEDRFYFLHVPADYDCTPWPVLLDFHGTVGGSGEEAAEEAYALDAFVAAADRERFLLLRPRSRYSEEGGSTVYRWDQNAGDLERNQAFTQILVADLRDRYAVGDLYASGFSNGTNMAMQLVDDDALAVKGVGLVGGGFWNEPERISSSLARVYGTTGSRDYMRRYEAWARTWLLDQGFDSEATWWDGADAGHDLYAWHVDAMWPWLERGQRVAVDDADARWTIEEAGFGTDLVALAARPDGSVIAVGDDGTIVLRSPNGSWTPLRVGDADETLTDVCLTPAGGGMAIGAATVLVTSDFGDTWAQAPGLPDPTGMWGGATPWANGVSCAPDETIIGVGYWAAGVWDGTWSGLELSSGSYASTLADLDVESGVWLGVGYYTAHRSTDGSEWVRIGFPYADHDWMHAVDLVDGIAWAAADRGGVLVSDDLGSSWEDRSPEGAADLYDVAVSPTGTIATVGGRGEVYLTDDEGTSWEALPTGAPGFLGGVLWLEDGSLLVVGEDGFVARAETVDAGRQSTGDGRK